MARSRGVAQPGSALRSGRRGPQFESGHPDIRRRKSKLFRRMLRNSGRESAISRPSCGRLLSMLSMGWLPGALARGGRRERSPASAYASRVRSGPLPARGLNVSNLPAVPAGGHAAGMRVSDGRAARTLRPPMCSQHGAGGRPRSPAGAVLSPRAKSAALRPTPQRARPEVSRATQSRSGPGSAPRED
jgi:hypothetical protein